LHLRGSELASTLLKHFRGGATEAIMPWCLFPADVKRAGSSVPAPLTMRRGAKAQHLPKWPAAIIASMVVIALSGAINGASHAEDVNISSRRSSERTSFTNDEIKDGFFKIAFDAELQLGKHVGRIRKFDEPVRVFVFDQADPKRRAEIAAIIEDIRAHVDHLDLAMTDDIRAANLVVMLVRKRDLNRTISSVYGRDKAKQIRQSLNPQCLSGFGKDRQYRIRQAEVILPVDASDFTFYDCAYEELLQALGPINDDPSVPWTMFNDDVQMGFFDVYDQYLLNILYDPRIRPGMTKEEVGKLLPAVLPAVREWIANTNAVRGANADGRSNAELGARRNSPAGARGDPVALE
jgi:hypothetical protein